jgi:hypothetical protein
VNTEAGKREIEFSVRVVGEPEIWDTLSGEIRPVFRFEKLDGRTKVRLQMEAYQGVLLVFRTTSGRPEILEDNLTQIDDVSVSKDVIEVRGCIEKGSKAKIKLRYGKRYSSRIRVDPPPTEIALDGQWGFKLHPTMDNRWGDFRYPPSPNFIGPEARSFCYMEEGELSGTDRGWNERDFDDSSWPTYTFSFGPYWWSIGLLEKGQEPRNLLEKTLRGEVEPTNWRHYNFSQKFGYEDVETHSVWGGILGVSDNFLVFDSIKSGADVNRYLFTFVKSPEDREYILDFGGEEVFPREAWVNGEKVISVSKDEKTRVSRVTRKSKFVEKLSLVEPARKEVKLKKGTNHVLLKLVQPGGEKVSTYASFYYLENPPEDKFQVPLLKWFRKTDLTFDIMPNRDGVIGWYRFEAPPGLRSITLPIRARDVQVWVNGNRTALNEDKVELTSPIEGVSQIALRVEHLPGKYAGAAFHEPVKFECDRGLINLGDWCDSALESYSGAAIYETTVDLQPKHVECRSTLDLGEVNSTAELWVNGKHAGIRLAQPYRYQITDLLQEGKNRLEVKVHNTLANHYSKGYPTKFVFNRQTLSGLIGPVKLEFLREIHISISQDK